MRVALLALALASPLSAQTAPLVITVAPNGQPHYQVQIKDIMLDVRLALSFDTALVLNTAPAQRAGLKPFPLLGKRTFKSALIPGGEATFRGNFYGLTPRGLKKSTAPVIWVNRPVADDVDGVFAATALKTDRIVFDLGPQAPGSKLYTLARKGKNDAGMKARIGDETIDIALELNSPDTVMNARAAAALSGAGLVRRNAQVGFWRPFPGVALPFERLAVLNGARLLGLPLASPGVRITEAQSKSLNARAGTSSAEDDEDAITVTADRKKGRDPWILIGRDVLSQCSRIEFDRPAKVWKLTCAFD